MKATTPSASAKSARRADRKRRRTEQRRLHGIRRARRAIAVIAAIAFAIALVFYGNDNQLAGFISMLVAASFVGLWLGATIRIVRERRRIEDGER